VVAAAAAAVVVVIVVVNYKFLAVQNAVTNPNNTIFGIRICLIINIKSYNRN
jgi:hypothetical protein